MELYKELRVGNLIEINGPFDAEDWRWFEATTITIKRVKLNRERYRPIPLTAEWLERLGFEGNINDGYALNGVELDYLTTEDNFQFEYGIPNAKRGVAWILVDIKYVHQLQNLFYCLTGEELTVK